MPREEITERDAIDKLREFEKQYRRYETDEIFLSVLKIDSSSNLQAVIGMIRKDFTTKYGELFHITDLNLVDVTIFDIVKDSFTPYRCFIYIRGDDIRVKYEAMRLLGSGDKFSVIEGWSGQVQEIKLSD